MGHSGGTQDPVLKGKQNKTFFFLGKMVSYARKKMQLEGNITVCSTILHSVKSLGLKRNKTEDAF